VIGNDALQEAMVFPYLAEVEVGRTMASMVVHVRRKCTHFHDCIVAMHIWQLYDKVHADLIPSFTGHWHRMQLPDWFLTLDLGAVMYKDTDKHLNRSVPNRRMRPERVPETTQHILLEFRAGEAD
jgi:hypothetical protein